MEITFLPAVKKVSCEKNTSLMEIMLEENMPLDFVCGGQKRCGKCKVFVTKGNDRILTEAEKQLLTREEIDKGYRLACCFEVKEDCCVIVEGASNPPIFEKKEIEIQADTHECVRIAFDIGTTTVEAAFLNEKNTVFARLTRPNPQRVYGLDVISRISYGTKSEANRQKLKRSMIGCLNHMIREGLEDYPKLFEKMTDIILLGNTTMISIVLNKSLDTLGKAIYKNTFHGIKSPANQFGIAAPEKCNLLVPGFIGGHVGSDTLGCILDTKLWSKKETSLIVDIGTNGEIVLAKDGRLSACSTAAGPAFEGANIVNGMRAKSGAIYQVTCDGASWNIKTVGDEVPAGICGSGLIDAAAVFLKLGKMDETGLLEASYIALDVKENVKLYQEDIRQLQLAKSAILSGIEILLMEKNTSVEEIEKIYLAGAFGSGLTVENAVAIGLLPDIPVRKFEYIGNGALEGGLKVLKEEISFEETIELATSVEHIELANKDEFREKFIENLNF